MQDSRANFHYKKIFIFLPILKFHQVFFENSQRINERLK